VLRVGLIMTSLVDYRTQTEPAQIRTASQSELKLFRVINAADHIQCTLTDINACR